MSEKSVKELARDYYYKHLCNSEDYGRITHVMTAIITGKGKELALAGFEYAYRKGMPGFRQLLNKKKILDGIQSAIDGVKPKDDVHDVVCGLFGYESKYKMITPMQRTQLSSLKIAILAIEQTECKHEHLAVIPLLYGGGFTPTVALPEIVCPNCWLNVTLGYRIPKELGLEILMMDIASFVAFANECETSKLRIRVQSSSKINEDPRGIYNLSQKFMGPYTIKVVDKALFESKSGV